MRLSKILALVTSAAAGLLIAASAQAMEFQRLTGPAECAQRVCVAAVGEIGEASAEDFKRFARDQKIGAGALVVLDSHGGNLVRSLELGGLFRKMGLATTVRAGGRCASACAYAYLGGVERTMPAGARLGVHQVSGPADRSWALSASQSQWLMSLVAVHLGRMGVEMEVLTLALRTEPQDMRWLSQDELVRYAVVTTGAQAASAD